MYISKGLHGQFNHYNNRDLILVMSLIEEYFAVTLLSCKKPANVQYTPESRFQDLTLLIKLLSYVLV